MLHKPLTEDRRECLNVLRKINKKKKKKLLLLSRSKESLKEKKWAAKEKLKISKSKYSECEMIYQY